jgi:hypothetical protein
MLASRSRALNVLKAFQEERQVEMLLLEEPPKEAEEAINGVYYAAATEATYQVHQKRKPQYALDSAIKNIMQEVSRNWRPTLKCYKP